MIPLHDEAAHFLLISHLHLYTCISQIGQISHISKSRIESCLSHLELYWQHQRQRKANPLLKRISHSMTSYLSKLLPNWNDEPPLSL